MRPVRRQDEESVTKTEPIDLFLDQLPVLISAFETQCVTPAEVIAELSVGQQGIQRAAHKTSSL